MVCKVIEDYYGIRVKKGLTMVKIYEFICIGLPLNPLVLRTWEFKRKGG